MQADPTGWQPIETLPRSYDCSECQDTGLLWVNGHALTPAMKIFMGTAVPHLNGKIQLVCHYCGGKKRQPVTALAAPEVGE